MEKRYSEKFFTSFVDHLQNVCRKHLNYSQFVEVSGYISVEIDNVKKERYVLSELLQSSGNVVSESYCTKAFTTSQTSRSLGGQHLRNSSNERPRITTQSGTMEQNEAGKPSRLPDKRPPLQRNNQAACEQPFSKKSRPSPESGGRSVLAESTQYKSLSGNVCHAKQTNSRAGQATSGLRNQPVQSQKQTNNKVPNLRGPVAFPGEQNRNMSSTSGRSQQGRPFTKAVPNQKLSSSSATNSQAPSICSGVQVQNIPHSSLNQRLPYSSNQHLPETPQTQGQKFLHSAAPHLQQLPNCPEVQNNNVLTFTSSKQQGSQALTDQIRKSSGSMASNVEQAPLYYEGNNHSFGFGLVSTAIQGDHGTLSANTLNYDKGASIRVTLSHSPLQGQITREVPNERAPCPETWESKLLTSEDGGIICVDDDEDVIDLDLFEDDVDESEFSFSTQKENVSTLSKGFAFAHSQFNSQGHDFNEELDNLLIKSQTALSPGTATRVKRGITLFMRFYSDMFTKISDLLSVPPEILDSLLINFYQGVKKSAGGDMSFSTLRNAQKSVNLVLKLGQYPYSILKDDRFKASRDFIKKRMEDSCQVSAQRSMPVDDSDMEVLFQTSVMGYHSSDAIIQSLWFLNTKFFGLRRPVDHLNLKWGEIQLRTNEYGQEYLERVVPGMQNTTLKVMSKPDNPPRCFVRIYKLYKINRPEMCLGAESTFYLLPDKTSNAAVCFLTQPLPVGRLTQMWRKLLLAAGLPHNKKII